MNILRIPILISSIFLFGICKAFCQTYDSLKSQKIIIAQIDSAVKSINGKPNCREMTIDGSFEDEKTNLAGATTSYIFDNENKELYRVVAFKATPAGEHYTMFYYAKSRVIYITTGIKKMKGHKSKIINNAAYYFVNDKLLSSFGEQHKHPNAYDILKEGQNYCDEFNQFVKQDK